jgi:hypothetical protein
MQSTSVFALARWRDTRNLRRRDTVYVRHIPRSTGTSERTWSEHAAIEVYTTIDGCSWPRRALV